MPGWVGRLGPMSGVTRLEVHVPTRGPGRVHVRVDLSSPRPIREVIGGVLELLVPGAPMPYPQSPSVAANGRSPSWLPVGGDVARHFRGTAMPPAADGDPVDVVSGIRRRADNPPPNRPAADVELVMPGDMALGFGIAPVAARAVSDHDIAVRGIAAPTVLLDVHGPVCGRWRAPLLPDAHGRLLVRVTDDGPRWRLAGATSSDMPGGARPAVAGPWLGLEARLDATDGIDPAAWWSVRCDVADDVPAPAAARLILRAALTGVVLDGHTLPQAVRERLSAELAAILIEPLPALTDDPLAWEIRSVRQRRAAVRGHATSLVMPDWIRADPAVRVAPPTVTALLMTRRPKLAALALRMLREQTYPRLEVIVGLHGIPTVPELTREAALLTGPVEIMELPSTTTLGAALGIVTARARGSFVAKIDDDDIYGPEHIWDLVIARALSGATVVGKGAEFVMLDQLGVTVRRDRMASDAFNRVVAGGTILVPRGELEAFGGWRPVPTGVDRAVLDRVLQGGGSIYRTWPTGFIYRRHGIGHTWAPADAYFLRGAGRRWAGIPDLPEFGSPDVLALANTLGDLF